MQTFKGALSELKKATLASYAKKAVGRYGASKSLSKDFGNDASAALKAGNRKSYDTNRELEDTFAKKANNRKAGIVRAVTKLAKEDVEHLEEVSTKLVTRYASKAATDKKKDRSKGLANAYKKVQGRKANVPTTNEEVEQVSEGIPPAAIKTKVKEIHKSGKHIATIYHHVNQGDIPRGKRRHYYTSEFHKDNGVTTHYAHMGVGIASVEHEVNNIHRKIQRHMKKYGTNE